MTHHTSSQQEGNVPALSHQIVHLLQQLLQPPEQESQQEPTKRTHGRPCQLSSEHLCLAILLAVLRGLDSYACIWRAIIWSGVGSFPLLTHTRDAIRKRLLHTTLDI